MNHILLNLFTGLVVAILSGAWAVAQTPVNVLATVGMIGDVARNVGGDCVDVEVMMGPGIDPHLYQASARDIQKLSEADIIFYTGYALEGQLGDVLERFGRQKPTLALAPAAIQESELIASDDSYGVDPHLWMDASLWAKLAPLIASELTGLAPDCAEGFEQRAEGFVLELDALHHWINGAILSIPEGQRLLVTAHDAFAYYGRAYGIEVLGIQGISTESEAGIADIRDTAKLVGERQVPAVFVESTINPRTIQAVVEAAAQAGHELAIGEELYSDAMGDEGSYGGTYIGMLYSNTSHIVAGLGGEAPALPAALVAWAQEWGLD